MIKIHVNKKIKTPVNIKSIKNFTLKFKVFISKKIHSDFENYQAIIAQYTRASHFVKKMVIKKNLGMVF